MTNPQIDRLLALSERVFRPLKQSILHSPPETYGDCQRTCLAMVLGLDPEAIPHFADPREFPESEARIAERAWLAAQGLGYVQMPLLGSYGWEWAEAVMAQQHGTPFIVSGRSPRGDWNHDVVYLDGEVYDPHPDGTGLAGPCFDKDRPDDPEWYWIGAITRLPGTTQSDPTLRAKIAELEGERDEARHRLRMVVSHATGGHSSDIDRSVNDICVDISSNRNLIFARGKEVGARESLAERDAASARVGELEADAQFLLDRLDSLEWMDDGYEQVQRDFFGHVEPAMGRLRARLARGEG